MQGEMKNNNGGGDDDDHHHIHHVSDGLECNACNGSGTVTEKSSLMEVDKFYEKLCKFNESSGLSLVFNFRETVVDLYLFYKEVIQRGGFSQVTKDRKWNEVVSALNLKSNITILPDQLQILYQILLHRYEQTFYYRTPGKVVGPQARGCSSEKRKPCQNKSSSLDAFPGDSPAEKRKCTIDGRQESTGPQILEVKQTMQKQSNDKALKKDPNAPLKSRTSYQMFLKIECERLKKINGENSNNLNIRDMAINAWRQLPESERQPYIEASKKDKERFEQEMAAYTQQNRTKQDTLPRPASSMMNFGASAKTDGDYYVNHKPVSGEFV